MITHSQKHLSQAALYALAASVTIVALLFTAFFIAEPSISYGDEAITFEIQQTITDETSFMVDPADVTMVGSIAGLTGGNATGTTSFVVTSNSASGYYVEIAYFDNGTTEAMIGDVDDDEGIRDFDDDAAGPEPQYLFTASTAAQFAYTVTSSTTGDTDDSFLSNGTNTCNTGSTDGALATCWKAPQVGAFRVVDRATPAVNGASSTVMFKVHVPNTPAPALTAQTYTATATLSVFVQ